MWHDHQPHCSLSIVLQSCYNFAFQICAQVGCVCEVATIPNIRYIHLYVAIECIYGATPIFLNQMFNRKIQKLTPARKQ